MQSFCQFCEADEVHTTVGMVGVDGKDHQSQDKFEEHENIVHRVWHTDIATAMNKGVIRYGRNITPARGHDEFWMALVPDDPRTLRNALKLLQQNKDSQSFAVEIMRWKVTGDEYDNVEWEDEEGGYDDNKAIDHIEHKSSTQIGEIAAVIRNYLQKTT